MTHTAPSTVPKTPQGSDKRKALLCSDRGNTKICTGPPVREGSLKREQKREETILRIVTKSSSSL